jgi:hypothetical protein
MQKIRGRESRVKIVGPPQSGNYMLKSASYILTLTFLLTGCGQKQAEDVDMLALMPDFEMITVPSDYAARALEVTGGLDAWKKTKKLHLDCVVTFYQPDGSFYVTEQHYEVYPWSNSIRISAVEPQGKFVWQLSKGQFVAMEGSDQFDGLPAAIGSRCLAELILNIVTVPVRFTDAPVEFARDATGIRMQGQWYYPITRRNKPGIEPVERVAEAILYQSRDSFLVDTLWLPRMSGDKSLSVRGYDYTEVEKGGVLVPAKIEIFKTSARGDSEGRLVRIDCHSFALAK